MPATETPTADTSQRYAASPTWMPKHLRYNRGSVECPICYETKQQREMKRIILKNVHHLENRFEKEVCDHAFCTECISNWIDAHIFTGNSQILCPEPDCSCMIDGAPEPEPEPEPEQYSYAIPSTAVEKQLAV
eukprot:gene24335-5326_t